VGVHYHSSKEAAGETVESIQSAGGVGWAVQADGTKQESVRLAVTETVEHFGRLDILVNNAGQHRRANSLEQSQGDWEDLIGRNLSSTFYFAQSAASHMKTRDGGQIVNISSKMAMSAAPSNAAYCAAKAGIVTLTQVLASEWARYKIRVNCVAPGSIEFPGGVWDQARRNAPQLYQGILAGIPSGRMGRAEEVANVVLFLASEHASWVTGQTLAVDGGQMFG